MLDAGKQEELPLLTDSASSKTGRFPKSARILKNFHYRSVQRHSQRLLGQTVTVQFQRGRTTSAKLGITVSKKFGKAHERNRFKRVVREAFRELYARLPSDLEMNIYPQKNHPLLSKQALLLELKTLLYKILHP